MQKSELMLTQPLPLIKNCIITVFYMHVSFFQIILDRVGIIHVLLMVLEVLQHIFKIFCLIKIILITCSDRFISLCNAATALKDSEIQGS